MTRTQILIDPRARLVYASQYIYGLGKVFGRKNVKFKMQPFVDLDQKNDPTAFDHYCALLVIQGEKKTRVVIDYRDKSTVNTNAYEWCDIYGKLNLNTRTTEKQFLEKSLSLGTMVAPRIWGIPKTALLFFINYLRCRRHISVSLRSYLYGYIWQLRRPTLNDYSHQTSEKSYVFFDSSLWPLETGAGPTNKWRALFIRTCKSMDLEFQGGLFTREDHPDIDMYKDVLLNKFVTQGVYIRRIKRSTLVFNTPSCHGGHGWKLGEFLAMGKAIVSTNIENDMPEALEQGKNIHFVKDEVELKDAIEKIKSDDAYRIKLEQGALEYYKTYLAPEKVVRKLLSSLLN